MDGIPLEPGSIQLMRSAEELRQEIEDRRRDLLKNGDIVDKMKEKAFYVPFMAMGMSLVTLYCGKRLVQARPADNPLKRPILFQFGMGVLGAMLGAQIGALWLQKEYFKLDPEGKLLADLKTVGEELKQLKVQEKEENE